MRPENRRGTPVDPVPFLVVAALGFLVCYSYGPVYLLTLGVDLRLSLAGTTAAFLATTAVAYYRLVWTARPDLRGEIPPDLRLRRLVLTGVVVTGLLLLLSLPLFQASLRP